jgi:hypothetical protein
VELFGWRGSRHGVEGGNSSSAARQDRSRYGLVQASDSRGSAARRGA